MIVDNMTIEGRREDERDTVEVQPRSEEFFSKRYTGDIVVAEKNGFSKFVNLAPFRCDLLVFPCDLSVTKVHRPGHFQGSVCHLRAAEDALFALSVTIKQLDFSMSDIPIDPDLDGELVQLLQDRHDEISSVYCPESENADIANSQLSSVSILTPPDASLEVTSEDDDDDDDDGSVDISEASQLASLFNDNQPVNGVDGLRDTGPNVDLDRAAVRATFEKGCGCKDECFGKLKLDVVFHHRLNMAEFTKDQRDILILAKLDENSYSGDTVRGGKRECQRFIYKFDGVKVCEKVWRYCYYVGKSKFQSNFV
ncbi:uncharacterized protein [Ptychodera flava]|uniref:uncharacterized protein isoform X1 n=1 Tax=Ptychodera flava TaxID=63121 RepID=UPI00396A4B2E